ncbi:MAG: hypothetical protein ISS36_00025 [Candidatus Aenigmarchaeota archaeon]|nr:hypothetical protein [Candidatus Aenigmarchaeota archaeon]
MKKKISLSIIILAIVFVSGCVQIPGGFGGGSGGVAIESFEPDFSTVYSGEQIQLRLLLRNTGSRDATNVRTTLTIFGESNDFCNEAKLLAADPEMGISGETKSCTYTVESGAPELPEKLSVTYTPSVRVEYGYSTVTVKSIAVGSYQELRKIKDIGGTIPTETITSTKSPVSLNIIAKGPVRVYDDSTVFPMEIVVSNTGGGVVCNGDCNAEDNWNEIDVVIEPISDIINIENCDTVEEISLFKGKSNTIGCKLRIDEPDTLGAIEALIKASAKYNYFVDASTQIKVTGIED